MEYIYLDNDASTRVDDEVLRAMAPFFKKHYGMASSEFGHSQGVSGRNAVNAARSIIAGSIGAKPEEIFFTSGVAESNNTAIRGAVSFKKGDMVTSAIEQNTVLNTMSFLSEHKGVGFKKIGVTGGGIVKMRELEAALTPNTRIVSIQHANQEMGAVQDVAKIGALCRGKGILFHTDASHSFLKEPIDVGKTDIDLMTLSSHNIYGPKGVAALYVRKGVDIAPLMYGGGEQGGIRPGLEDVPSIVGFGKAVEIYDKKDNARMAKMRDSLITKLLKIKDAHLNGPDPRAGGKAGGGKRICSNANVTFKYVEGESLLLHLDMRGIGVTTGSACFSRDLSPSHVIIAMGGSHGDAHGSVRFSLSKYNKAEQMGYVAKSAKLVVEKLREISPLIEGK